MKSLQVVWAWVQMPCPSQCQSVHSVSTSMWHGDFAHWCPPMFACGRRRSIIKRLLSQRALPRPCPPALVSLKRKVQNLLRQLEDDQLEALQRSIKSLGATETSSGCSNCVITDDTRHGTVTTWNYFRQGDVEHLDDLQQLPFCQSPFGTCINPFHYGRKLDLKSKKSLKCFGVIPRWW